MKRSLKGLAGMVIFLSACGDQGQGTSADDRERPVDWSANWTMHLVVDTIIEDRDVVRIEAFESDRSLDDLSDELFAMAFSGDAQVYAPDLFGSMDTENALEPKALFEALKSYDTVYVEDIYTGDLKDTVVDNSFTAEKASAMIITMGLIPNGSLLQLQARHLGMGVQVFDPLTGKRRGDAKRFYMRFNDTETNVDHLKIYTDSLGHFVPAFFEVYAEETSQSLKDWIVLNYGVGKSIGLSMRVELSFKEGVLKLLDVQINPAGEAA